MVGAPVTSPRPRCLVGQESSCEANLLHSPPHFGSLTSRSNLGDGPSSFFSLSFLGAPSSAASPPFFPPLRPLARRGRPRWGTGSGPILERAAPRMLFDDTRLFGWRGSPSSSVVHVVRRCAIWCACAIRVRCALGVASAGVAVCALSSGGCPCAVACVPGAPELTRGMCRWGWRTEHVSFRLAPPSVEA